ncbi:MAG: DUF2283 domain-containing protein [Verrucomicrobia bacterium]|nr:DUF2283 domain-containing protein [Verrucomicrobiota bacterium]
MRIDYDDKTDLLYMRFDDRPRSVMNKRVSDDVVLDVGAKGRIVGIEIMDASRHVDLDKLLPVRYRLVRKAG